MEENWTKDQVLDLIAGAKQVSGDVDSQGAKASIPESPGEVKSGAGGRRGARLRNQLLELADDCEFLHDQDRRAFATVHVTDHFENMRLSSQEFGIWFSGQCHKHLDEPVGEQALRDAMRVLEACAIHDGLCHRTSLRIGRSEGKIYLDLGKPEWDVIVIDADGWRLGARHTHHRP